MTPEGPFEIQALNMFQVTASPPYYKSVGDYPLLGLVMNVTSFSCALPFSTLGINMAISSLRLVLQCASLCGKTTLFQLYALLLSV
jgi:hypothetical protein